MAQPVEVVNAAVSTAGATQNVTVSGLGTPDMVRVWAVRQVGTGTAGTVVGVGTSYGASDFTTTGALGQLEEGGSIKTDTYRFHFSDRVVHFADPSDGSVEFYGTVATTTDGVTISWFDGGGAYTPVAGQEYRLVVELWKITGITPEVHWVTTAASHVTAPDVATTTAVQPEVLLVGSCRSGSALGSTYPHGSVSFGATWWASGTVRQQAYNYSHRDAQSDGVPDVLTSTSNVLTNIFNGTTDQSVVWTGRGAMSFTLTTKNDTGSMQVLVCVLDAGTADFYLSRDAAQQSTGVQSHTLGMAPDFVWNVDTYAPLETQYFDVDDASGWASTVMASSGQGTVFARSAASVTPIDNYCGAETGKARYLYTGTGTERVDGDFDSLTATGYDVNYATAAADERQSFTFAIVAANTSLHDGHQEDVTITESQGVFVARRHEGDDAVTITDGASYAFRRVAGVDESVSVTDSGDHIRFMVGGVDESVSLTDGDGTITGAVAGVDESLGMTESAGFFITGGQVQSQMPKTRTSTRIYFEGTSPILIDRVWDDYAADIVDRDKVVEIIMRVFDLDSATPNTATVELPFSATEILLAALSTHASGEPDTGGYNFLHRLDGAWIPEGGRMYRVEYTIVLVGDSGETPIREIPVVFELRTRERYSG